MLEGIKPCAGLDKKTQQATVARINEVVSNKEKRKIRKSERIQRRTERRQKRALKKLQKAPETPN